MAPTNEQISKDSDLSPEHDEGDTYDEDTGEFLGNITPLDKTLPAQLAIFHAGYWYIFKPASRYKQEDGKTITLREELSGTELAERGGQISSSGGRGDNPSNNPGSPPSNTGNSASTEKQMKDFTINSDKDLTLP